MSLNYICVQSLLGLLLLFHCKEISGDWEFTSTVREEYIGGLGSQCGPSSCGGVFVRQGVESGSPQRLRNGCRYTMRIASSICNESAARRGAPSESCVEKDYFYYLRTDCYGQWLSWESCSAECGGGIQRRYKFSSRSNVRENEQDCNTHTCPMWSNWVEDGRGCEFSCMKLQMRQCRYQGSNEASERCPSVQDSSYGGNGTHRWLPCTGGSCITTTTTTTTTATSTTSTSTSTTTKPPGVISRITTIMPTKSRALQTTTDFLTVNVNNSEKGGQTDIFLSTSKSITENSDKNQIMPMFGNTSFWVGFCIGAVSVSAIVLLTYFMCMKFGKSNICPLNQPCLNYKTFYDKDTSGNSRKKKAKKSVIVHHTGNSSARITLENNTSCVSTSSLCKDEGNKHRPSNGSVTPHSKLEEPYQQPIEQIAAYETFYTPVGETKYKGRKLPCQPQEPIFEAVHDHHASSESFLTDTDSNSEMPQEPNYENGTFYNRKQYLTEERKCNGFDEAAYIRKYDERRVERNRIQRVHTDRHYGNSESLTKKRRPRRRKSYDSPIAVVKFKAEPHYAKPMKFINGRAHVPRQTGTIDSNEDGYAMNDSMPDKRSSAYWKRVSVRSISTPALGTPVKIEDEKFEFPSPPKFVVGEQPLGKSEKERNNIV